MTKQQRDTFEGHIEQAMRDAKTSSPDALGTGKPADFAVQQIEKIASDRMEWQQKYFAAKETIDTLTRQRDALLEACKAIDQAYGIQTYSERVNAMRKGWQLIRSAIALAEKEGK